MNNNQKRGQLTRDLQPAARGYRILFVGPQWHGSNSTGLARAFRRLGHIVETIDEQVHFPIGEGFPIKLIRRCFGSIFARALNTQILEAARALRPDLVVVFKGNYLKPATLVSLKTLCRCRILFYPDVSMFCHTNLDADCLRFYDWIYTTKSFGVFDLRNSMRISKCELLHHGFDPTIHRPVYAQTSVPEQWLSDAAFIGTWSPKKEQYLLAVANIQPRIRLRIWGSEWRKVVNSPLGSAIIGKNIFGDTFPLAIAHAKINIAILSEIRPGASNGDRVTSRTFHIPASGGFMLHERSEELSHFYREGEEVACFATPEELAAKVKYYLKNEEERERIRIAGHRRCIRENDLINRANRIIENYEERCLGNSQTK